ncbi:hypothetical protein I7I51_08313 [Histoplasma capsulatum]|uniref:Uncharacterized protein n=1 Tax=Ajellomyces capsulatus TaxID=5037 RepID=A0A8A1M297_AJECA|nr:hypothetical protein I7I51_08313 [Histoplasma capsulatum]
MVDLENVAARNQCLGHRVDALVGVWRLGWLVSRLVLADLVSNFVVYYHQYSSTSTKAGIYLLASSMELLGAKWDTTLYHQKHSHQREIETDDTFPSSISSNAKSPGNNEYSGFVKGYIRVIDIQLSEVGLGFHIVP